MNLRPFVSVVICVIVASLSVVRGVEKEALLKSAASGSAAAFVRLSAQDTGLDFKAPFLPEHPWNFLYHSGFACGSAALGDVNGDGWPDLFFTNGPGDNALYLQDKTHPWRFERAPETLGLGGGDRWGTGSAMVDLDNDGDLDIYVCNYRGENQLFVNQFVPSGEMAFVESASAYGLNVVNASLTPAFADYDRDGDLDLYLLNNRLEDPNGRPEKPPFRVVDGRAEVLPEHALYYHLRQTSEKGYEMDSYGQPDRLYRNEGRTATGSMKFQEVTQSAGIAGIGHGLSATWWDYNADGFPDLYVGNDFTDPDRLYRNDKDGTFTEVLADTLPYCSWSSMGSDSADLNNDGLPDLLSADMAASTHYKQKVNMGDMSRHRWLMDTGWPRQMMRNMLYVNTGTDRFMETAFMSGLARTDWTWAVKCGDFDNDGWVDVFFSNGMVRNFSDADIPMTPDMLIGQSEFDIYKDQPPMPEKNLAYRNRGGLKFDDVSKEWGLDTLSVSYGAAYGDLDRDGDLDLVVMNLDDHVGLYRNDLVGNERVTIVLTGTQSNRSGIGATIRAETEAGQQMRYVNPMTGFQGCNLNEVHFGLGDATKIDRLTIDWPSGSHQMLSHLATGFRYQITEPSKSEPSKSPAQQASPLYAEVAQEIGLDHRHQERVFDDFAAQPLLPSKLSQLGPGLAVADVDGDGRDDVYVGGAAGAPGALFRNRDGAYVKVDGPWTADQACEDMGAAWLDVDRDGDLDLYVGSGGVEYPLGSAHLSDRLYVNEGQWRFVPASKDALPRGEHSTSAVALGDYDRDGDLDLFVGARSIPGKYPLSPQSRLLRNDGVAGKVKFVEVMSEELGLVTSAVWMDADRDGWADLLLGLEWDAPAVFRNDQGRLVNVTELAGLSARKGWWNGLSAGDLDQDGDLDVVAMNVGFNTKYGQPSVEKPSLLYYGDMDGTGESQLIEAKLGENGLLPIRGRSCSSQAMPFIAKKFTSFRSFAAATLEGIYTPSGLEAARRFEASEFASGLLFNESKPGDIKFRFEPLPWLAQASPGYGVAIADVDGDALLDIVAVGNLYTRERETGLWRGGLGTLLRGDGKGGFSWVEPLESGFLVPGDAKALAVTDINGDGAPDFLVAQNNDRLMAFRHRGGRKSLQIALQGPVGNPTGIGAQVIAELADGKECLLPILGTSGYLSQSTAGLTFMAAERVSGLRVIWPNGFEHRQDTVAASGKVVIRHPDSRSQ